MTKHPFSVYHLKDLCTISLSKYVIEIDIAKGTYGRNDIEEILNEVQKVTNGKEFLVLVNCKSFSRIKMEGLKLLASEDAMRYGLAKAYVIRSWHQRLMSRLFRLIFRPTKPVRFFDKRREAYQWLNSLVH